MIYKTRCKLYSLEPYLNPWRFRFLAIVNSLTQTHKQLFTGLNVSYVHITWHDWHNSKEAHSGTPHRPGPGAMISKWFTEPTSSLSTGWTWVTCLLDPGPSLDFGRGYNFTWAVFLSPQGVTKVNRIPAKVRQKGKKWVTGFDFSFLITVAFWESEQKSPSPK